MEKGDVFPPCVGGSLQGFEKAFVILGLLLVSGLLSARANLYYDYDVSAALLAETAANSVPVRVFDGGLTLAMLGVALLILGWARKRLKRPRND